MTDDQVKEVYVHLEWTEKGTRLTNCLQYRQDQGTRRCTAYRY
jgi:hypothetical protein